MTRPSFFKVYRKQFLGWILTAAVISGALYYGIDKKIIVFKIHKLKYYLNWYTIISGVAIKKGYATELAKGRIVTLGLLIGMIIGYILGHLIPLQ